jgi:hypothetical protein
MGRHSLGGQTMPHEPDHFVQVLVKPRQRNQTVMLFMAIMFRKKEKDDI